LKQLSGKWKYALKHSGLEPIPDDVPPAGGLTRVSIVEAILAQQYHQGLPVQLKAYILLFLKSTMFRKIILVLFPNVNLHNKNKQFTKMALPHL